MDDFEWIELDPEDYDAVEVRGVVVDECPEFVLIGTGSAWDFYAALHADTDGLGGLEHIDGYPTLAAAQAAVEPTIREFLSNPA